VEIEQFMLYPMVSKCQIRSKVEIEQNNSQVAIYASSYSRQLYTDKHEWSHMLNNKIWCKITTLQHRHAVTGNFAYYFLQC